MINSFSTKYYFRGKNPPLISSSLSYISPSVSNLCSASHWPRPISMVGNLQRLTYVGQFYFPLYPPRQAIFLSFPLYLPHPLLLNPLPTFLFAFYLDVYLLFIDFIYTLPFSTEEIKAASIILLHFTSKQPNGVG